MNKTLQLSLITTLLLNTNLFAQEQLEDITVTSATKTNQALSDVTSNINVITAEEIEERHYTTVIEALNSLPGVSFTSNGGLGKATSFNLRGMDSKHTLILVDGVRYQDPSNTTGASIQHLIISDIERIEVIKGAQSGIWGPDASAGVINIITKEAKEGISFHASQEFGSFNTSKTDLGLSYKNKDFYLKATHTDLNSESFTALAPRDQDIDTFEDDGYSNKTSSVQAGVTILENGTLEVGHTNIEGLSEYDSFGKPDDESMKSDIQTKLSYLKYTHKFDNHTLQVKHEVSDFEREEIGTSFGVKNFNGKTTNSEINDQ
ncbi:MAG TPA: TonB-dependent receptor, partial [Campylobacterales bacterium]|nr:TonB-dependent receptor [Campylobacterales bacterium]